MLHVLGCITEQHDLRLVVLAALLCVTGSWTAISLASRARVSASFARSGWTVGAGFVFGTGVWATHFVAMLAYKSSFAIGYDIVPTVGSILVAVSVSTVGFWALLRGHAVVGGMLLGLSVCLMHYVGMDSVEGPFHILFNFYYVASSVIVGVTLATLAALAGISIQDIRGRILATGLLVASIVSLHFTAMTAVTLAPDPTVAFSDVVMAPQSLAIAVAAAAMLIVGLGLTAALLDSHLALRRTDEAARLRAYIVDLESTRLALQETAANLTNALAQASAANDAKSAFLAAMSHELRTPLNAVIGFSDLILTEPFGALGNARYKAYLSDIRNSGSHLLDIINDVLDLSRLDAGQENLSEEEIDIDNLMESALRMVRPQADSSRLRVSVKMEADLPCVLVDARRIRQVLLNVLSNAVKFTPENGDVHINVDAANSGLRIRIADTGIGIAREDMRRVFERFGQVDSSLARKYEGTGLGLPLARQLTELHGGTLTLESELGVGTTVTIVLPLFRLVAPKSAAA
jgi:signal transduction histidine kinase